MSALSSALEGIAHVAVSADQAKVSAQVAKALETAALARKNSTAETAAFLGQLEEELKVWQTKLAVILREPVGRQGMSRHARHWVEQLQKAGL